jgi:phage regulator Rha-like protein
MPGKEITRREKENIDAISYKQVEEKILTLRGENVILDSDIAELYGVESREINQAVKNNPEKFPDGYIFSLNLEEWNNLKSKFLISSWGGKRKLPSAFTEKGLYMLATILKSPKATQTTIAIVETFTKLREFSRNMNQLSEVQEKSRQKALMRRSGEILADIIDDNAFEVTGDETTIELNFAILKVKHTIRRTPRSQS